MKVVVDTNVLVSAVLRDRVPEEIILFIVQTPGVTWVVSDEILAEYKEVLARPKFKLPPALLSRWYEILDRLTSPITVTIDVTFERDQKDAKFLACCLAADADFFITGDRDFEGAQKLVNTKIISVSLFKQLVIDGE